MSISMRYLPPERLIRASSASPAASPTFSDSLFKKKKKIRQKENKNGSPVLFL